MNGGDQHGGNLNGRGSGLLSFGNPGQVLSGTMRDRRKKLAHFSVYNSLCMIYLYLKFIVFGVDVIRYTCWDRRASR